MTATISVEFCGEWYRIEEGQDFVIGRDADLSVDEDNPFLHRRFLTITQVEGMWWLVNIGTRLSATITDGVGAMQAWLAPGARLPLVFGVTKVVFTAGPTTYDLAVHAESLAMTSVVSSRKRAAAARISARFRPRGTAGLARTSLITSCIECRLSKTIAASG